MEILDEQRRRSLRGELGQELDPGVLETVTGDQRMKITRDVEPHGQSEQRPIAQALEDRLRCVRVEQPEVLLEHFGKRPVGDALPVGETAARALERLRLLLGEPGPELADESRLADSGIADDRDQMWLGVIDRLPVARAEELELCLSSDEGVPQPADTTWAHERECADETSAHDAARLSLGLDGAQLVELEGASHRGGRPLADQDLAGRRGLLEPCADVDHVAGNERAALARPTGDDLAGVDTDPERKFVPEQLLQPSLHRERRVQRPLGVILLGRWCPESGHHRVADELLDRAAGRSISVCHRVVEEVEPGARALGILGARELGRAHEVGEEHCRDLALLARRLNLDRRGAARAVTRVAGERGAALDTRRHLGAGVQGR